MPESLHEHSAADRGWNLWPSIIVGSFVFASLIIGFLVLPARDEGPFNPFAVICRALGVPGYAGTFFSPGTAKTSMPVSDVSWDSGTQYLLREASVGRGAVLAKNVCGSCHGVDGKSTALAQFPNLAGQSEAAIFKELRDFRSGDRTSPFMQPVAQMLKDQQMADVAAYYAEQPASGEGLAIAKVPAQIVSLAHDGDPDRAVPSCDSCHGASRSGPEGAPILLGQSVNYLEIQLKSFAAGGRRNDLFERMRIIARQLTPEEMHELAIYYQGISGSK